MTFLRNALFLLFIVKVPWQNTKLQTRSIFGSLLLFVPVVSQYYEAQVYDVFTIKGNAAVFKCNLPSFVSDHLDVVSWTDTDGGQYMIDNVDYGKERVSGSSMLCFHWSSVILVQFCSNYILSTTYLRFILTNSTILDSYLITIFIYLLLK